MQEFGAWVKRARAQWGDDLDLSCLPEKWACKYSPLLEPYGRDDGDSRGS